MNHQPHPISTLLLFASGALAATAAQARPPTCDVIYCSAGCYEGTFKASDVAPEVCDEPKGGIFIERLYPNSASPSPAVLHCERVAGGYACEAWPQDEGLSYLWSTSGSMWFGYSDPPEQAWRFVGCGGSGTVTMTVVAPAPSSMTATTTRPLSCNPNEQPR